MERWTRFSIYLIVSFIWAIGDLTSLRNVFGYSTASTSEAAYIIGGDRTRDVIAEFKNDAWRNLGSLVKPRDSQGSISLNGETMIIGGYSGDSR